MSLLYKNTVGQKFLNFSTNAMIFIIRLQIKQRKEATESEEEAICNEATATCSEVTNFCREIFEKTQKYLRKPTPKSEGSKRSSKCSSMRAQIELKMHKEKLERQDEAHKKLLEAELHLKLLQVDEEKRKKVQAAKDKVWLSELDKNSEDSSRTMQMFKI